MNWQTIVAVLLLTASGASAVGLAAFFWRRRAIPGGNVLAVAALAVALWCAGYALELIVPGLAAKTFWVKVQYAGVVTVPPAWLLFALRYSGRGHWLSPARLILLALVPALTLFLAWSNELHRLLWARTRLADAGPFTTFSAEYGPAWFVHAVYSYLLIGLGTVIILLALRRTTTTHRWQLIMLLLSPVLPWVANVLYIAGRSPVANLDLTPFAFLLSVGILAWGTLRFQLFNLAPIARWSVVERLPSPVFVLNEQNQVVDANAAARQFCAPATDSPVGRPISSVLGHWPQFVARFIGQDAVDERVQVEVDGGLRTYNLRITPLLDEQQNRSGRVVILHDVSQQKAVQETIARAHIQAEQVARVSHEMRAPLNAILGYSEMLKNGVLGTISETQRGALEQILERTTHLSLLVNDLLDVAQMESGTFALQYEKVAVAELIRQVAETMRFPAEEKGLELACRVRPDVPGVIWGDAARLYQVLCNLTDNAIKFTEEGYVRVTVSRPEPGLLAFEVEDSGMGIPEDMQGTVFAPFVRAPGAATQRGLGLGLSIAQQLVEQMQGRITLQSKEGQGSRFTVTLPLRTPGHSAPATEESRLPAGQHSG